jgi:valyl-tRNA synthetase
VKNELPVLSILLHAESLTIIESAQEGPACQDRSDSRNHTDPALTSSALLAKRGAHAACPTDIGTIYLPLEGIIDAATEAKRLDGEIQKVEAEIEKVAKKLSSETFVQNAPAEVVADHRQRQQDWLAKLAELQKARLSLG